MAAIEKRSGENGTSYRVKVRIKGYPAQSATFERLTDAKKWAQQTESAIRERRYFKHAEARKHTLADLIDKYVEEVLPAKRVKTRHQQEQQLTWWRAKLGAYSLVEITPALVVQYRDLLAKELISAPDSGTERRRSPATVVRYMAILSHVFTIAVKEYAWTEDNPLRKVSKPKEPRGRVRFLSDDEILPTGAIVEGERTRLLKACKASLSPDLYTAVVLALSTGARKMELLGLRWRQVDLARGMIMLEETKNNERRSLPLAGHALDLMSERSKVRLLSSDLVFPDPKDAQRPVDLRVHWEATMKAAGIEDFRWHDLRHSAASYLAMSGASMPEIAEILGHKTLAMVKRYAHLSDAHVSAVVARMNNRVFGG